MGELERAPDEPVDGLADAVAVGPGEAATGTRPDGGTAAPTPAIGGPDASLLGLVDRLAAVLDRSDLGELEVVAGGTTILLRAPSAIEHPGVAALHGPGDGPVTVDGGAPGAASGVPASAAAAERPAGRPSVKAPLTGIFYAAPSPGATPYVAVGDHVAVGQVIGLIEAMKLFNEIKSDLAGRVVRVCADSGALVKAKQPLVEVEPG